MPRYAIEITLLELDELGYWTDTLETMAKDVMSDSLESMKASMEWLDECLGNAMYDHVQEGERLYDRATGELLEGDEECQDTPSK